LLTLGIGMPDLPLVVIALGWIPQAALTTGGFNPGRVAHERVVWHSRERMTATA
jgi:hypothetical protein